MKMRLFSGVIVCLLAQSALLANDPFEQANKENKLKQNSSPIVVRTNPKTQEQELIALDKIKGEEVKQLAGPLATNAAREKFMAANIDGIEKAKVLASIITKDQDASTPASYRRYWGGGWYGWDYSYSWSRWYYSSFYYISWSSYYYYSYRWSYSWNGYYYDWYY
jgi:hypothetical protein